MRIGWKRAAVVAGLGLAIGAGVLYAGVLQPRSAHAQTAGQTPPSGITVTGSGTVKATPNQAQFSFGVETQADTSAQAVAANSTAVQKVIDAVKNAGVAASDIQTQQVSVSPRYSENGQKIVGYTATNTVNVTIRDLSKAGKVVDAAVAAGANNVYGPSLSVSQQDALYAQALKKAYADAKSKAQTIAGAAGVSVGRVLNLVEGGGFVPLPATPAAADSAGGSVPIEPGQQDIQAMLTVTFAIS